MKLLSDTLENMTLLTKGVNKGCYRYKSMTYKLMESCKGCGKPYLANIYALKKGKGLFCDQKCQCKGKNNPFYGKHHTKESKSKQGPRGKNNPSTLKYWLDKCSSRSEAVLKHKEHNRKNSTWCVEYWLNKGYTKKQAEKKVFEYQSNNGKKVHHNGTIPTQLEYWLNKGYTKKQAKEKLKERQITFSLEKCIEKYGEEKGLEVWKERQEKWLLTLNDKSNEEIERINRAKFSWGKNTGYSKISQELFWKLYEEIKDDFNDIYFAQLGKRKGKDISGKNHEYFKILPDRNVFFDFFVKDINKIIEFDGDYWHCESRGNVERDKQRDISIKKSGYDILHIREKDWKSNHDKIINKCKGFLYEDKRYIQED